MHLRIALAAAAAFWASAAGATVVATSTFDANNDGWTGVAGETTALSHQATGGNPGGFIQNVDSGPTAGGILAPAKFLGDWSGLDGAGVLTWDFKLIAQGTGDIVPLVARISGPGGVASFDSGILTPVGSWVPVAAPIDASAWSVASGDWPSLLGNVTELRLMIENVHTTGTPGETTGIDNVVLAQVPEPATAWLLVTALAGLARRRLRRALQTQPVGLGSPA